MSLSLPLCPSMVANNNLATLVFSLTFIGSFLSGTMSLYFSPRLLVMLSQFLSPAVFLFNLVISSLIRLLDSVSVILGAACPTVLRTGFLSASFASNLSASLLTSTARASASSCFCCFAAVLISCLNLVFVNPSPVPSLLKFSSNICFCDFLLCNPLRTTSSTF